MEPDSKSGLLKNKKLIGGLVVFLVAIPLIVGGFALFQKNSQKNNPQVLAANQVNDILVKVGKLIDIPDETPTVATVSDVTKLQSQEFFAKAQNGDKVIIFPNAKKAILYRPSTDKIVEVALYNPPVVTPQVSQEVATPVPTKPISLRDLVKPSNKPSLSVSPSPKPSGAETSPTPTISPTQEP